MTNKELLRIIDSIVIREGLPEPFYNETIDISGEKVKFLCSYGRQKIGIHRDNNLEEIKGWSTLCLSKSVKEDIVDQTIKEFLESTFIKADEKSIDEKENVIELCGNLNRNILNIIQTQILPGKFFKPSNLVNKILSSKLKDHLGIHKEASIEGYIDKQDKKYYSAIVGYKNIIEKLSKNTSVLFDLASLGQFPKTLDILLLDEDPEVSIISIVDFLLVWQIANRFGNKHFPIERISIKANYNENRNNLFKGLIDDYIKELDNYPPEQIAFHKRIKSVLQNIEFVSKEDLILENKQQYSFLLINNYFSQFDDTQMKKFNSTLSSLSDQSIISIIEKEDRENHEISTQLFTLRKQLFQDVDRLFSISPCGQEFGNNLPRQCDICRWQKIVEFYVYKPEEYCTGKVQYSEIEYQSNYSYVSMKFVLNENLVTEDTLTVPMLSLGIYSLNSKDDEESNKKNAQTYFTYDSKMEYNDYLLLCPGNTEYDSLFIKRKAGQYIPTHEFGKRFEIESIGEFEIIKDIKARISISPNTKFCEKSIELSNNKVDFIDYKTIQEAIEFPISIDPQVMNVLAYRYFGFDELFGFQHKVMKRSLLGKNILAIASTGGGKSECYILPSLILQGMTLVISPLKSLMQDQYEERIKRRYKLQNLSAYINSTLTIDEKHKILNDVATGKIKLLFLTPEQLDNMFVMNALKSAHLDVGIRYLALDEAHCISQWGHDFRPAYLNIRQKLQDQGIDPVVIALTATASDPVKNDICNEVGLSPNRITNDSGDGDVYVFESNRGELNLISKTFNSTNEKIKFISDTLGKNKSDSSIVFMPWAGRVDYLNRKNVAERSENRGMNNPSSSPFASFLERLLKEKVSLYNSKLEDRAKIDYVKYLNESNIQPFGVMDSKKREFEQMLYMRNDRRIMVATKGFGMGIDKSDIRCILHRTTPDNLEAYMQEAGRAGRDQKQANVYLLYSPDNPEKFSDQTFKSDYEIQIDWIESRYMEPSAILVFRDFIKMILKDKKSQYYKSKDGNTTRVYFTNDQFIDFADKHEKCAYPDIVIEKEIPKLIWGKPEYIEEEMYENGQEYEQKTKFLKKIIEVTYKIRPKNKRTGNISSMIHRFSAKTPDSIIKPVLRDFDVIISSNYYFGNLFRERCITEEQFREYFEQKADIFQLSKLLNLTMNETCKLLSDMKDSYGKPISYKAFITSFLTSENPYESNSRDFFEKYGTSPNKLKQYRSKQYNKFGNDAKHFSEYNEITRYIVKDLLSNPTGWEFELNNDILKESYFSQYYKEFEKVHLQRKEVDYSAFRRLLTSYIGVTEDGKISRINKDSQNCLREVVLGYLNSRELVKDGNCKACSVCVPDLKFERYSEDERKAQIISAEPVTILAKEEIDVDFVTKVPTLSKLNSWIEVFEKEESSIWGYLDGFTNKLLTDYNGSHIGALFLRLKLYQTKNIMFQSKDVSTIGNSLLEILPKSKINRLENILANIDEFSLNIPEFFTLMLNVYEKRDDNKKSYGIIVENGDTISNFTKKKQLEIRKKELKYAKKIKINKDGQLDIQFTIVSLKSGYNTVYKGYKKLNANINQERVESEIKKHSHLSNTNLIALLINWCESDDFDLELVWKFLDGIKLNYNKDIPWEIVIEMINEGQLINHKELLLDILNNSSEYDEKFNATLIEKLITLFDDPSKFVQTILSRFNEDWLENSKIMKLLDSQIKKVKLSDKNFHQDYLNQVTDTEYFTNYFIWFVQQEEADDERLANYIKKIFEYTIRTNKIGDLESILLLIKDLDLEKFNTTIKVVCLFKILLEAKNHVNSENPKEIGGRRDNAEYYYKLKKFFKKQIKNADKIVLQKEEIGYLWFQLFDSLLGDSRYLTLRKIQAEALIESRLWSDLKELDVKMPGIQIGQDRVPLYEYLDSIDTEKLGVYEIEKSVKQNCEYILDLLF